MPDAAGAHPHHDQAARSGAGRQLEFREQPARPRSEFTVTVNGQTVSVSAVGFKRRVLYAPLDSYDLRIQNSLYLQINGTVADNAAVIVTNPDSQPLGQQHDLHRHGRLRSGIPRPST